MACIADDDAAAIMKTCLVKISFQFLAHLNWTNILSIYNERS